MSLQEFADVHTSDNSTTSRLLSLEPLSRSMVRSHIDYAVSVWDSFKIKHITDIEDVQRRATKLIPEIKKSKL